MIPLLVLLFLAGCGDSNNSDAVSPSNPSTVSAKASSASTVDLSWSTSTDNVGVAGYKLYRNGVFIKYVTSESVTDDGLSTFTQYCYTVSAVDFSSNESSQSSQVCTDTNPKYAQITLGTVMTPPPSTTIYIKNLGFDLILPNGVTPKAVGAGADYGSDFILGEAWNILQPPGPFGRPPPLAPASFLITPATGQSNVKIGFWQGSSAIGLGDFLTVLLEVEAGRNVTGSDFSLVGFIPVDLSLNPLNVTPSINFNYL